MRKPLHLKRVAKPQGGLTDFGKGGEIDTSAVDERAKDTKRLLKDLDKRDWDVAMEPFTRVGHGYDMLVCIIST